MEAEKSPKTSRIKEADDTELDVALRPRVFDEYIGQDITKQNLSISIAAAQKRGDALDHVLFSGPSGLGKTTLAYLIAREFGANIRITSGTALEKAGDVGSILTGLTPGDFLFIDEVHRLNKSVEETLYPAMENYKLDIVIGKGTAAKTLQVKIPKFTLVAATTRTSLLSNPFRSRFGSHYKLDFYNNSEIEQILKRSADLLGVNISKDPISIIAGASRFTPRIANRLLRRVRDYSEVNNELEITKTSAVKALELLGIDELGLENTDRQILSVIAKNFNGGPAGLKSIAAAISEEEDTIEEVYEPFLIRLGLLSRTARGRVLTDLAQKRFADEHNKQSSLL